MHYAGVMKLKTKSILIVSIPVALFALSVEAGLPNRQAGHYYLMAAVTGFIAVFLIVSFIIKYFIKPLELFTRHVEDLPQKTGDGRFLDIKTKDEIGTLSWAFNKMVTEIDKRRELERSEELYRTVTEFSKDFVFWRAHDNNIIYVSENCEKFCGYTEEEFYAAPELLETIVHPEDRNIWAEHTRNIESKGISEQLELRIVTKSGEVRWISHNSLPVYDKKGNYNSWRGCHQDTTERKQFEEALIRSYMKLDRRVEERTNELSIANATLMTEITERKKMEVEIKNKQRQLEELNATLEQRVQEEIASRQEKEHMLFQQSRMAAMGEMMGAIAHQWRQPLNVIGLIIQNLKMAYEYGELNADRLQNAVASTMWQVNFMSKTIDDFRNFFKPSKAKELFEARDVVVETISLIKAQLQNNYIDVEVIAEKEGLVINGYPNEFKHVLLNLINNAKDAILLRKAQENCPAKITIEISGKADKIILTVRDTGGGIPDDIMSKIFDPYFTTKDEGTGTGIGLYISKTMIERNMGGQLTARNWKEGAEFMIEV